MGTSAFSSTERPYIFYTSEVWSWVKVTDGDQVYRTIIVTRKGVGVWSTIQSVIQKHGEEMNVLHYLCNKVRIDIECIIQSFKIETLTGRDSQRFFPPKF